LSFIALLTIDFISSLHPYYNNFFEETITFLDNYERINAAGNEWNRLFLILFIFGNGIIIFLWENFVDLIMGKDKDNEDD